MLMAWPKTEADHFMRRPGCDEWFDMRDLGQVLAHVHYADIEIGEGPRGSSVVLRRHRASPVHLHLLEHAGVLLSPTSALERITDSS